MSQAGELVVQSVLSDDLEGTEASSELRKICLRGKELGLLFPSSACLPGWWGSGGCPEDSPLVP